ncbi:MAG TPA: hypothetical protein VJ828_05755, partial [Lacipirellulaceae bacterium]|nr:hypothetical protein [Lacipirellulaceae bacterium]
MHKPLLTRFAWASTMCAVAFAATSTAKATIYLEMSYDSDPFLSKPEQIYAINAAAATWSHWLVGTIEMQLNFDIKHDANQGVAGMTSEFVSANGQMQHRALWKFRNNILNDDERDATMYVNADLTDWYAPGRGPTEEFLDWYARTGGKTPAGHYDLTTIAIHELGHALGHGASYNNAIAQWGLNDDGVLRLQPLDAFLRDHNGLAPIAGTGSAFDVTEGVTFVGPRAQAALGGPVPIYSPDPFSVSSLSHTAVVDPSNANLEIGITNPFARKGFAQHGLFDFERGIFEDLGWQFRTPANLHINTWWGQDDIRNGLVAAGDTIPTAQWHDGSHWWGTESTGELLRGLPPFATTNVHFHMEEAQSDYRLEVHRNAEIATLRMGGADDARALIEIYNGTLHVNTQEFATIIGDLAGQSSEIVVSGFQSGLNVGAALTVGQFGSGGLTILLGASVENTDAIIGLGSDSVGTVLLQGAGSTWINHGDISVGHSGQGLLLVKAGTTVASDRGFIGNNPNWRNSPDWRGTVSIEGVDATWLSDEIQVGSLGHGSLRVENSGSVDSPRGFIGASAGAHGTVTIKGMDSNWTNDETLIIGQSGEGKLVIEAGGSASQSVAVVGYAVGSTGDVSVTGFQSELQVAEDLTVGQRGAGSLTIEGGGAVDNQDGIVALESGSTGSVAVGGTGSRWINTGNVIVGYSGEADLEIHDSASVVSTRGVIGQNFGSMGTIWVEGEGATWTSDELQVGTSGFGSGLVENGGTVATDLAVIGTLAAGNGQVTVRGSGSTWTNSGQLSVGGQGDGLLRATGGGRVASARGLVGASANSDGIVQVVGDGSTWTNSEYLVIGFSGEGSLRVDTGASVSQPQAFIGYGAGSTGSVEVVGAGSTVSSGSLIEVGREGAGMLTIESGGVVNTSFGFIGSMTGSTGAVTITGNGSELRATGSLFVGGSASQSGGTGTLMVNDGARVVANTVHIWSSGTLGGDAAVQANVTNGGRVRPGDSPGRLDIVGNYAQQTGGALDIELGGSIPELQYDALHVTGT